MLIVLQTSRGKGTLTGGNDNCIHSKFQHRLSQTSHRTTGTMAYVIDQSSCSLLLEAIDSLLIRTAIGTTSSMNFSPRRNSGVWLTAIPFAITLSYAWGNDGTIERCLNKKRNGNKRERGDSLHLESRQKLY